MDAFEGSYNNQLVINMPYKRRERKFLQALGRKAKQGLKYGALVDTDILPYPALQFKDIRKSAYKPLLSLIEPSFDNVEKLDQIKCDVFSKVRSEIIFRERLNNSILKFVI